MIDTDIKVPTDVAQEIMRMHLKEGEATMVSTMSSSNGDFNVLRLTSIAAGDLSAVSEAIRNSTRSPIERRNGGSMYEAYLESLDEELDLQIKSDLL